MSSKEGFIQVTPDSSGKQVRNVAVDVLQPDGTTATVYMQAVSIYDRDGNSITPQQTNDLLASLLREIAELRRLYGHATQQYTPESM